jgi:hypothetical protein
MMQLSSIQSRMGQPFSVSSASVKFQALTLEVGKPLPCVIQQQTDGKGNISERRLLQKQLKREMSSVETIVRNWIQDRQAQIDKITQGLNIKLKLMTEEDYNFHYTDAKRRKRERTFSDAFPGSIPTAARLGMKLYHVDESTQKETKMQVRWPGNNPDGPLYPLPFQDWAESYILKPKNLYDALSKALKMAVANIGVENNETYEDKN